MLEAFEEASRVPARRTRAGAFRDLTPPDQAPIVKDASAWRLEVHAFIDEIKSTRGDFLPQEVTRAWRPKRKRVRSRGRR